MEHNNTGFSPESLRLVGAALALQHASSTAASMTPIPSTGRFVVIGTPAEVARLLEVAPSCGACAGDGSMCKTECRHQAENPPAIISHDHSEGDHHD